MWSLSTIIHFTCILHTKCFVCEIKNWHVLKIICRCLNRTYVHWKVMEFVWISLSLSLQTVSHFIDGVFGSSEKEKILALLKVVLHSVWPHLQNHRYSIHSLTPSLENFCAYVTALCYMYIHVVHVCHRFLWQRTVVLSNGWYWSQTLCLYIFE